jgi:hypothetical protein
MAKHKVKRYAAGELVEKKVNIDNPGAYKVPLPEEPSYEDEGRMSDLSTKVVTSEGKQADIAKPKIITKEELANSGLTLREYMNRQQGLKPRGESEPAKSKLDSEMASRATSRATSKSEPSRTTMPAKDTSNTYRDLSGKVKVKEPNGPAASQMASDMAMSGAKKIGSGISRVFKAIRERGENPTTMASGGMTSSASKRADGIATKGKTRGKIC